MAMELGEMFELEKRLSNVSYDVVIGPDYFYKNMSVSVPYLVVICLATISGTIGNVFVIGAVLVNKVSK